MKRYFKRVWIKMIRARQKRSLYYVAQQLAHEYPSNWSTEDIVAELKRGRG